MTQDKKVIGALLAVVVLTTACTGAGALGSPLCHGAKAPVEGVAFRPSQVRHPIPEGRKLFSLAGANIAFKPLVPAHLDKPLWIRYLRARPPEGPQLYMAFDEPHGPTFVVNEKVVDYGVAHLRDIAGRCRVSSEGVSSPGASMTTLADGTPALLLNQTLAVNVEWIVTSREPHYTNTNLRISVMASGRLPAAAVLALANKV